VWHKFLGLKLFAQCYVRSLSVFICVNNVYFNKQRYVELYEVVLIDQLVGGMA